MFGAKEEIAARLLRDIDLPSLHEMEELLALTLQIHHDEFTTVTRVTLGPDMEVYVRTFYIDGGQEVNGKFKVLERDKDERTLDHRRLSETFSSLWAFVDALMETPNARSVAKAYAIVRSMRQMSADYFVPLVEPAKSGCESFMNSYAKACSEAERFELLEEDEQP